MLVFQLTIINKSSKCKIKSILFYMYFRYLQKARYKKSQRKADKSTNVISVPKKGKSHVLLTAATTVTNSSKPAVTSNCNVGGVNFIIPKIEQPEEQLTAATIICKPFEPNNISSSIGNVCNMCIAYTTYIHSRYT